MSKGKEGEEIDLTDLPAWQSYNVGIRFGTCQRTADKINKQLARIAEDEEYITVLTRDRLIEAAKDNMLFVDMENLTEK